MELKIKKIADYLLLQSSYMQEIGLFHGKMGVALALNMYSSQYNDKLMEEYAWDLFQQVYDKVHIDMPVGLETGLAGIGYGTTLLYKYGLVSCDLNEILMDVDSKIMERDPRRMSDLSAHTGLGGVLQYIALRQSTGEPLFTFDTQYLMELNNAVANNVNLKSLCQLREPTGLLTHPQFKIDDYIAKPLGIDDGCAYFILDDYIHNNNSINL